MNIAPQHLTLAFVIMLAITFSAPVFSKNQSIYTILNEHYYQPTHLNTPNFKTVIKQHQLIANNQTLDQSLVDKLNANWAQVGISHIEVSKTNRSAKAIYQYVEHMNVGKEASSLNIANGIATLSIKTMMGRDNETQIEQFMHRVINENIDKLIIDLRGNAGGAFVVKSLLPYFTKQTITIGGFVSNQWYQTQQQAPTNQQIIKAKNYDGNSLQAFWSVITSSAITSLTVNPASKNYNGTTIVLVDSKTESAAELTIAGLKMLAKAKVVGTKTAGKMLSQKMFDIANGVQISIPVANYISINLGQIEGNGISPDIEVPSHNAHLKAVQILNL